jgi:peptidyl-prolyl cis-trans isomerase A (cyclophilin A)
MLLLKLTGLLWLGTAAAQPAVSSPSMPPPQVPVAPKLTATAPPAPALAPSATSVPAAAPAKATAAAPSAAPEGGPPFTLAQATQGLPGNGVLRATIEVEQAGKWLGTLRCELYTDKTPQTVANFVGLARGLRPFHDPRSGQWVRRSLYDGNQFHRLIPDFLIQGGDPLCLIDPRCSGRQGAGDPGYAIPDEIRDDLRFDRGGRLGMALRGGANTAGSQFFITERETPWLNGSHTVFGQCEPIEVVRAIAGLPTQALDVPKEPVRIKRILISRQPATGAK